MVNRKDMELVVALITLTCGLGSMAYGVMFGNELLMKIGHYFNGMALGASLCRILGSDE